MVMTSGLPASFKAFFPCLDYLFKSGPSSVALAGSYGNPNKKPNRFSDLDILFVFPSHRILSVLHQWSESLTHLPAFSHTLLGVHPQFGHLVAVSLRESPTEWIDVGIMDTVFSEVYMTALPLRVLSGSIQTSGMPPDPLAQMEHLLRKRLKAKQRGNDLAAETYCLRYLQWLRVLCPDFLYSGDALQDFEADAIQRFPHLHKTTASPNKGMESDEPHATG